MLIRNTVERFGLVAKTLHWLTLMLVVGAFTLAISMVNMPFSPRKLVERVNTILGQTSSQRMQA